MSLQCWIAALKADGPRGVAGGLKRWRVIVCMSPWFKNI